MPLPPGKPPGKPSAGEWRPTFLAALRNSANVRASALMAGISRKTAYDHRKRSTKFRDEWDEAMEDACDVLEAEARRRAVGGSDTLLIFLLKSHRPQRYVWPMLRAAGDLGALPAAVIPIADEGDLDYDYWIGVFRIGFEIAAAGHFAGRMATALGPPAPIEAIQPEKSDG